MYVYVYIYIYIYISPPRANASTRAVKPLGARPPPDVFSSRLAYIRMHVCISISLSLSIYIYIYISMYDTL